MRISKHASKRIKQRGISDYVLLLVSMFGEAISQDKTSNKLILPSKTAGKIRAALDKSKGKIVIVDNNYQTIITAYSVSR